MPPIYMRTDGGEVLLEDFANGFYLGMQLNIDDWKPHISNPEIGHPLTAILGHCTTMMPEDQRQDALRGQAGEILAKCLTRKFFNRSNTLQFCG
ncbi:UPF0149 family protein [Novosphingobium resinovorum]|uniref:UPF0149 family protein n=2 Tax=Sphingomonadaceae TaxID=41297 RepID=UPI00232A00AE|nr:hypothetical protein GCM10017612_05890 [Novosphingobium resinovorum]